mmetsp:Transcript_40459/g.79761  ORF Transcript_40459/g.79761 Transcript_40459/m.79761 type:complete len:100 (+) Transcript_40459:2792-3091(+)
MKLWKGEIKACMRMTSHTTSKTEPKNRRTNKQNSQDKLTPRHLNRSNEQRTNISSLFHTLLFVPDPSQLKLVEQQTRLDSKSFEATNGTKRNSDHPQAD